MSTEKTIPTFRLTELWCLGKGFWTAIWFFNGANGASWLPLFSNAPQIAQVGRIGVYFFYCLILFAGALLFRKKQAHLYEKKVLLNSFSLLSSVGVICVCLAGFGVIGQIGFIIGMIVIGAAGAVPLMAWGEFYAAVGPRRACLYFSASGLIGATIYYVSTTFGPEFPLVTSILFAIFPLVSQFMYFRTWKSPDAPTLQQTNQTASFKILPMPMLVLLVYGAAFGFAIGLNDAQVQQGESMINLSSSLGMILMAAVLTVISLRDREFTLSRLYRPLVPLLVVGFLLLPLLGDATYFVMNITAYAGYMYIGSFAACLYAAIATRRFTSALLVSCVAVATYSSGIMLGSFASFQFVAGIHFDILALYYITAAAIALIIITSAFLMNEEKLRTLWGLISSEPLGTPIEIIEQRSIELASEKGLTLRETNVLVELAKGLTADQIAKTLFVSTATVRSHQKRIYAKLYVHSQAELINTILNKEKNITNA